MYNIRGKYLYCGCAEKWKVKLEDKGVYSCPCGTYTYSHTYRPHDCGCRGKYIHTKKVKYGENEDFIS